MFAEERQEKIAELVAARSRVTVAELADLFKITTETVRRDLAGLENTRRLRRVHGGAVALDRLSMSEPSLGERQSQHLAEKIRIAAAAAVLIPSTRTGSVLLDSGTTTALLAEQLTDWAPASPGDALLVITNALPIAHRLSANPELQLEILGGRVRGLTSAIVGATASERLEALRPDIAFVGANGVHAHFGLSTPDSMEAAVKTAIVRSARRVVALVDSSKLGEETLVRFATLREIDTLITDARPAKDLAAALTAADVELVIA
ncbi:DeoR/GlpR family DNA-binding transcription regulator [Paenarthrobacter sp. PH39-S1]|uniref:DeoR/GlpR family DNA-binding transcription regulator n=1 Tax=Paenarthrobacter sp. PH39-S1 TaxID=3046204 RepID=UPI0024B9A63D|nr:DeoR/GlpR family DNA-binding transcription regulator [Paenarthrobacter sp. PH39-S1]MDJ0354945.1 DeoR/GlpR family DNA-binding transcription regulator [Paenarthrobacter sp. PH39-S1]